MKLLKTVIGSLDDHLSSLYKQPSLHQLTVSEFKFNSQGCALIGKAVPVLELQELEPTKSNRHRNILLIGLGSCAFVHIKKI
uniref:Uncharacterized protein n=1 Tax=Lepeophtheirus salmonis TaxID=72036 RepID=A0A0K2TFI3_LEPSM